MKSKSFSTFKPWNSVLIRLFFVLLLFTLTRIFFYFLNISSFGSLSFLEWLVLIPGGVRFDVVAVLYINILYILGTILPFGRNNRVEKTLDIVFVASNSVGLLLNCIDSAYYPFNLKRMTWTSFGELQGFNNALALLPSFLVRYWYVWVFWLVLVFFLVKISKKIRSDKNSYTSHTYFDAFFLTFILMMFGFRGNLRYSTRPLGLNDAGRYVESPQNVALVFSTPFSIFRTIGETKLEPYHYFDDENELEKYFNPVQEIETDTAFREMNVVVLVLESFSEEASSIGNSNPEVNHFMPFLDSLRRKSFYTEYSFSNGRKSIEALPAIWGSIASFTQPYVLSKYSSNKINSLPIILKEKGYHTSFFHGAPNGSMGFNSFSNLMGIDHYYGKDEFGDNSRFDGIWGIWDQPFVKYFAESVKKLPQPFMTTLFTVSSHDPYKVPNGFEDQYPTGPHPIYKTFAYTDDAIRMFFEDIKDEPWFNNTLFIVSADHTTPMLTTPEFTNSLGVFRVPVFFYAPGLDLSGKVDRVFQQIDILPTALHILQYDKPFVAFGKDLLNPKTGDYAISRFENYQYIYGDNLLKLNGDNEAVGLYKYKTDKLLEENLIKENTGLADSLQLKFRAFIQQFQNRMIEDKFQ